MSPVLFDTGCNNQPNRWNSNDRQLWLPLYLLDLTALWRKNIHGEMVMASLWSTLLNPHVAHTVQLKIKKVNLCYHCYFSLDSYNNFICQFAWVQKFGINWAQVTKPTARNDQIWCCQPNVLFLGYETTFADGTASLSVTHKTPCHWTGYKAYLLRFCSQLFSTGGIKN